MGTWGTWVIETVESLFGEYRGVWHDARCVGVASLDTWCHGGAGDGGRSASDFCKNPKSSIPFFEKKEKIYVVSSESTWVDRDDSTMVEEFTNTHSYASQHLFITAESNLLNDRPPDHEGLHITRTSTSFMSIAIVIEADLVACGAADTVIWVPYLAHVL